MDWGCDGVAESSDICVSVRPRAEVPFERVLPPLLCRESVKPRSRVAIVSVPRYLYRSAKRLIGGSVQRY